MNQMYGQFKDRAEFILVYLREAHPADGWSMGPASKVKDPTSFDQRSQVARHCSLALKLDMTMLVDTMDDRTAVAYAGWPDRIYVVDKEGRIAYAGQQGPWGFWPTEAARRRKTAQPAAGESLEAFLTRTIGKPNAGN